MHLYMTAIVASVSRANVSPLRDAIESVGTTASSVERLTEELRWLAVLERVAERLLRSSLVDLGTGVIGLCCFSPLL